MSNIKLTLLIFCSILCIGGCSSMDNFGASLEPKKSDFPNHPIELIVPFGAGGGSDTQARLLEKFAYKHLKQPLVVINKPGGAGTLGWNEVLHAKHDGYTLGVTGIEVLLHTLYQPSQFHYFTTLDPLAQIATTSPVLLIKSDEPWQNLNELITYAKQHPQELKYGHYGIGSLGHVLSATFVQKANIQITQVPFRSGSESLGALLGGHVHFIFMNPAIAKEHIKAGTIKAIAISSERRICDPIFADVPTLKELGFDIAFTNWIGIAAPKELPPDVKSTLEEGLRKAIAEPEFKELMAKIGMEIEYLDSEQSRQKWVREIEALKKMLDSTGILEEVRSHQK